MNVEKKILPGMRYVKGTIGDRLVYYKSGNIAAGHKHITHIDVDWVEDPDERRYISGFYIL